MTSAAMPAASVALLAPATSSAGYFLYTEEKSIDNSYSEISEVTDYEYDIANYAKCT